MESTRRHPSLPQKKRNEIKMGTASERNAAGSPRPRHQLPPPATSLGVTPAPERPAAAARKWHGGNATALSRARLPVDRQPFQRAVALRCLQPVQRFSPSRATCAFTGGVVHRDRHSDEENIGRNVSLPSRPPSEWLLLRRS